MTMFGWLFKVVFGVERGASPDLIDREQFDEWLKGETRQYGEGVMLASACFVEGENFDRFRKSLNERGMKVCLHGRSMFHPDYEILEVKDKCCLEE